MSRFETVSVDRCRNRTKTLSRGEVGVAWNPEKIEQVTRDISVADSIEMLEDLAAKDPTFEGFVKVSKSINKEAILSSEKQNQELAQAGLRRVQSERAFVNTNCEIKQREVNKEKAA